MEVGPEERRLRTKAYGQLVIGGLLILTGALGLLVLEEGWAIVVAVGSALGAVILSLRGAWLARRSLPDWRLRLVWITAVLLGGSAVAFVASAILSALANIPLDELGPWFDRAMTILATGYAAASILLGGWWFLRGRKVQDPKG